MNSSYKWALWLTLDDYELIKLNPVINKRVEAVRNYRLSAGKETQKLADQPWRFGEIKPFGKNVIVIPRVSSENRDYLPLDYIEKEDLVVSDAVNTICNAPLWLFGILLTNLHIIWLRAVGGKLKTDYRYSQYWFTIPFQCQTYRVVARL